ncbi:MAG: alpha/beta hydrolase [Betaproteobacteria bacterium]|nr:alpha/beta hydrolase [Betaproteobacteria bacterium]
MKTNLVNPKGSWVLPIKPASSITMLYFHGGGYSFNAAVTQHFVKMLAQVLNVKTFSLDYRLTPEHPHPAQIEDAVAAYRYLLNRGNDHKTIVVAGDSAGGHLALMTLIALKSSGLPQPALAIALSPWTDTGKRGQSLFGNDRFDMVQGYQTQQYSEWLKAATFSLTRICHPCIKIIVPLPPSIYKQEAMKFSST